MKHFLYIWIVFFAIFSTASYADITTGLVAHYEFEGDTNDSSGNNYHLTTGGTKAYNVGKLGQGYSFNGVDNNLTSYATGLSGTTGTVSYWLETNASTTRSVLILGTDTVATDIYVNGTDLVVNDVNNTVSIFDNTWHHIVISFTGGNADIYLDGTLLSTGANTISLGTNIYLGHWLGLYQHNDMIDDVRVYDRALTSIDVTELYSSVNFSLNSNFIFDGNTTLLDNSFIDAYLSKQDATTFVFLGNLANTIDTNASILSYDYNDTFDTIDENQTLTIRLSIPMNDNVSGMTVLHTEANATNDLNLSKTLTLSSLSILVEDIGNMREIVFHTTDGNFSGNIILDGNDTHVSSSYQIPVITGDYTIGAAYTDGNFSYYDSSTNSWGGTTPTTVSIAADMTLASVPAVVTAAEIKMNISSVNLNDFNVTSIRAYTPDSAIEDLFIYDYYGRGGSASIIDYVDNNYSVPIFYPDNNFTIEVNQTIYNGAQLSWYYNFSDGKLYPDINSTTDFRTEIFSGTNPEFTMNTANREYYTFNGSIVENDNNVTAIYLHSESIGLGLGYNVNSSDTSYSLQYSELGNHIIFLSVDGEQLLWYYDSATGDINATMPSTYTGIDTSTTKSFDLNLSSANFENYTSVATASVPPSITHIYDRIRKPGFGTMVISFDVNDSDTSTLYLDVNTTTNNLISVTSSLEGNISANTTVTLTITELNSSQSGHDEILVILSDGYSHVYKNIHLQIENRFDIISNKEADSSAYNSNVSTSYTGTLYVLNTCQDYNQSVVEYEKIEVLNSALNSYFTVVKELDGVVQGITTKVENIPSTIAFESTAVDTTNLNTLYSDANMPFAFTGTSQGQRVYVSYPDGLLETYDDINYSYISPYTNFEEFMVDQVKDVTPHGIMRNYDGSRLLVFDTADDLNNTATLSGNLIELDENGTVTQGDAGDWNKTTFNGTSVLSIHPDLNVVSGYHTDTAFLLDTTDSYVKPAEYKAAGDVYNYVLLNKEAKDELYNYLSPNPKLAFNLNNGYTYVALPNSKSLCDSAIQGTLTSLCDQNNTLESIFGINSDIDTIFKYTDEWVYWDSASDVNASYFMNKFSSLSPLDGLIVHTTATTTVNLPFDFEDIQTNTYENMPVEKWIMLSNNKEQTVAEIEAAIATQNTANSENKILMYIQLLRDNQWYVYAPTNDSLVDSGILRLSTVKPYESFWIYLK